MSTCDTVHSQEYQDDDNLTDDQIQQLLLEAEGRLRSPESKDSETSNRLEVSKNFLSESALSGIPKLSSATSLQPYVRQQDDIVAVDSSRIIPPQKELLNVPRPVEGIASGSKRKDKQTAGSDWFDLPKTQLTPELKRDLQLLRMRSVLDPKRHYKKESGKAKPPEFSQVGTVVQGPTEFFSARIAKKDRKSTFVEETLALEQDSGRFRAKYMDIQASKTSGKKAYYKNLRAKRSRRRQAS
ncbi:hypothetical protein VTN00DRAFT_8615 [Thermoascus crustaceus]|uniref:uncharacterized protein n=1 Tax=Thermoascus crustaceus TaxID=5088 RepID=UPI003742F603